MKTFHPFLPLLLAALLPSFAAAEEARPNIVFIFSDDHSKNSIGCYGNTDIKTPGLDRLAAEGMRFEHALTPNSFCTPSRAVVLTGKYSHKNGVHRLNQRFDGSQQTFPKLLQAAGYETALFGKWHLLSQPTGFDHYCVMKMQGMAYDPRVYEPQHEWIEWGPKTQKEAREGGRVIKGYNNDVLTDEALNWLKGQQSRNGESKKPFCLLIHPKPPHEPYSPPKKYEDFLEDVVIPEPSTLHDDYKGRAPEAIADIMTSNRILLKPKYRKMVQADKRLQQMSEGEQLSHLYQIYIKGYYRLVKSVDDNVAKVLDYLEEHYLEENTIVLYSSDQGFALGEHGLYNKQWMYEPSLHQPLIVRYPGVIAPRSVHHSMVSHVDIAPTLLDIVGQPIPDGMQGHSLKGILAGNVERVRDASYYHFYTHGKRLPEMIGIRTDTHKLIHYPGLPKSHRWEMFDLKNDPEEMKNLYRVPGHKNARENLKDDLRILIETVDDPVEAPDLMSDSKGGGRSDPAEEHPSSTPATASASGVISKEAPSSGSSQLAANLEAGKKQTVITYGTSLTKVGAWSDQLATVLEQSYPGQVTFINSGQGGSNSDWGSRSFDEKVIQNKPDTIFIEFAINDAVASRKTGVKHARRNLEGMIDQLSIARPGCEIILMVMNPPVGDPMAQRPNLAAYNQMYRDVASKRGFQLIDHYPIWEKLLNEDPGRFMEYVPDGIHPVREGALGVILPTMIKELGLKPGNPELNERAPCWNYLFRMMDKKVLRNQQVSREEYDLFWENHFEKQDVDGDGRLKPDEYKPTGIFKHIDANADGTIGLEEYQEIYAVHFERRDTNSDEKLVEGEIWRVK